MAKKLYDILFEDASPAKRPDLKARLATLQAAQKSKADQEKASSPSGKLGATGGGISQQQLVQGSQEELKKNVEAISAVADKLEPSEQEVKKAKEALKDVPDQVQTISHLLYPEMPKEQPKASKPKEEEKPSEPVNPTAKTEPQQKVSDIGTAPTQEVPAVKQPARTQEVPQADIQAIMAGSRQRAGVGPGVSTEVLPAAKPGLFNRLKQGVQAARQRVGLEEEIKQSVKEALKTR